MTAKIASKSLISMYSGLILVGAAVVAAAPAARAEDATLTGSWSGSGKVVYPSGATESARCKANFRQRSGASVGMTAVCATSSARVEQTATLSKVGPNRFAGDFQNSEYGFSGSIRVTVNGNSLSASLIGGGGSASFNLSR